MEAAAIDGASRAADVLARHAAAAAALYLLVALLLRAIFEFRAFDNIYVMTSGGPANATMMLSMYTYLASFVQLRPQPRRGGVMDDAADRRWSLCLCFIAVIRRRGTRRDGACARASATRGGCLRRSLRGLIVADVVFLFPLLWIVGLSFKTRLQVFASPPLFIWWPTLRKLCRRAGAPAISCRPSSTAW